MWEEAKISVFNTSTLKMTAAYASETVVDLLVYLVMNQIRNRFAHPCTPQISHKSNRLRLTNQAGGTVNL
jgi:hypothetical protein